MGLTTTSSEAFEFKFLLFLRNSSRRRLLRLCRELSLLAGDADLQGFSGPGLPLGVSSGCSAESKGCTLAVPLWLNQAFAEAKGGSEQRGKFDQHHNYTGNPRIGPFFSTSFEEHQILLLVVRRHFFFCVCVLLSQCPKEGRLGLCRSIANRWRNGVAIWKIR